MKMLLNNLIVFFALTIFIIPAHFGQETAITFREPFQKQSIYAFASGLSGKVGVSGRLYLNQTENGGWKWADLGRPSTAELRGTPDVISYPGSDQKQKIYAFARGEDDQLYVAYKSGNHWRWSNQGKPFGVNLSGNPSVITYEDMNGRQRIYAFIQGENGQLYVNFWDGFQWRWANQGKPSNTRVSHFPMSAITYQDVNLKNKIYVFMRGDDGSLYVNYWDGFRWGWANQGRPNHNSNTYVYSMDAITYRDNNNVQRIYTFVSGSNGRLSVNYWDGRRWRWADQGAPANTTSYNTPSVITYRDNNGRQRIYSFVTGGDNQLYANVWDGSRWSWITLGTGFTQNRVMGPPSAITYKEGADPQKIYVFFRANDRFYYTYYWNGTEWNWQHQGNPLDWGVSNSQNITNTQVRDGSQSIYAFYFPSLGNSTDLYVNRWNGSSWQWMNQGKPTRGSLVPEASAIAYRDGLDREKIYSFATGLDGNLYVNYNNGSRWAWANQGKPNGNRTDLEGPPSTITYFDNNRKQVIYSYVIGSDNNLYVNYWDGFQWRWENRGKPDNVGLIMQPEAITHKNTINIINRNVYAIGSDKGLYEHVWDSYRNRMRWIDWGKPENVDIDSPPTNISYMNRYQVQSDFTFVRGSDGHLYVHYFDLFRREWDWSDLGRPNNLNITGRPSAITYLDHRFNQRIYTFVIGAAGNLHTYYFNGSSWAWANLGQPANGRLARGTDTRAITFCDVQQEDFIQVYAEGENNELYMLEWNGRNWTWYDQGFRQFVNGGRSMLSLGTSEAPQIDHTIFPNPFNDHIMIDNATDINKVTLISEQGEIIESAKELVDGTMKIDLSQGTSRYYTIQIETDEGVERKKILKAGN